MEKNSLKNLQEAMCKDIYGVNLEDSLKNGLCVSCKEEALPKCYSEAGRKEFSISGLCEKCFDELTWAKD